MNRSTLLLCSTALLAACTPSVDAPLRVESPSASVAVARPGFTASWTVDIVNDSESTYDLTALSIRPDDSVSPLSMFRVELEDGAAGFPLEMGPQDRVTARVFFTPTTLGERHATLQAVTFLADIQVGGGGCSTGVGREAPEDALHTVWAEVVGTATADADYEVCGDGLDNDGDGAFDCDDRDCADDVDCLPTEGCRPTDGLLCDTGLSSNTAARSNSFDQYCRIATDAFTAAEEVWTFLPSLTERVVVTAAASGWDLDLILLRGSFDAEGALSCDPDECTARAVGVGSTESIEFTAEAGAAYFFVLDGAEGEEGSYELTIGCGDGEELDCNDGLDDDGDGFVDCDDIDCGTSPDCFPSGVCEPDGTLGCGDRIAATNAGPASTNDVFQWCDAPEAGHSGPEVAWHFVADTTSRATITLSGLSADLDLSGLLLNPGGGGTCDPDLCVFDEPWVRGTGSETITFDAFTGSRYVLAVDGWQGAESDFTLDISCR